MAKLTFDELYGLRRTKAGIVPSYSGEVELILRDPVTKQVLNPVREKNLVKIQAKEIIAHRLPHGNVWDPTANGGAGAWVSSGIDPDNELSIKYILFGASFNDDGAPLSSADDRFYSFDSVSNSYVPIRIGPGAEYGGGLINPIPISEPSRPLKRIERVYFESSYQPAGTPLLQDDVRAINNVVVFETTLLKDEYNGFGGTASDFFTITEVLLVAGKELGLTGACECDPHDLFLEGGAGNVALAATATGTATITLSPSEAAYVDVIKEGDTVKIVEAGGTVDGADDLGQVSSFYLVVSKVVGGSDIVLDRTPATVEGVPLSGSIGVFKDGMRVFSARILSSPVKKSSDYEICCRWRIALA